MVIVSDYMEKVNSTSGQTFVLLELSGGLELVQSQNTGKFYATSRKCRIPSTFNAEVAKLMVGQQIDGDIVRVESDPYAITDIRNKSLQLPSLQAFVFSWFRYRYRFYFI